MAATSRASRRSRSRPPPIKVEPLRGFLVTAAYFNIKRTQAGVDPTDNFYKFIGRARFEGIELSAVGELTRDLSLYLTGMALTPRQIASPNPLLVGKVIENTPRTTASAFVEYRFGDSGFAVKGGAYYTGARAINASNTAFIPDYTLFDLGASYATQVGGKLVTFRVNGENITGKRYFAATGSSLLGQGLPSVVKFSVDVNF